MIFSGESFVASYRTTASLVSKLTCACRTPACFFKTDWIFSAHAAQSILGIFTFKTALFASVTTTGAFDCVPRSIADERLGKAAVTKTTPVANYKTTLFHLATGLVAQVEPSSQAAFGFR